MTIAEANELRNRALACLLAGGLGDALGYEVEFDKWKSIQNHYGTDGIRRLYGHRQYAHISDDTQMTLFTLEGMLLDGAPEGTHEMAEDIYQAYLCWLQTQGYEAESKWKDESWLMDLPELNVRRAPGITCLNALSSGVMGTPEKAINDSKGCGGVMRTAPLGFLRNRPGRSALENGARAGAITHGHPMGWVPAGMLSDIVERCFYGEYTSLSKLIEDSLEETILRYGGVKGMDAFVDMVQRALKLAEVPIESEHDVSRIDEPAIRSLGEGWVGDEALAIAIYAAVRYEHDLKGALIAAVNHNGDSDSTGAIAGNILGAYLGMDAIPREWAEQLELTGAMELLTNQLAELYLAEE